MAAGWLRGQLVEGTQFQSDTCRSGDVERYLVPVPVSVCVGVPSQCTVIPDLH